MSFSSKKSMESDLTDFDLSKDVLYEGKLKKRNLDYLIGNLVLMLGPC